MSRYTVADLSRIAERLAPEKLFLVRAQADLEPELMQRLWLKVMTSWDPDKRAGNLEYPSFHLDADGETDPNPYVATVFWQ